MKTLRYLLILIPFIFTGCVEGWREKRPDDQDFRLKAVTNAPVNFNEELEVKVENYFEGYYYEMDVPSGIKGSKCCYSTDWARYSHEGWYVIRASIDDKKWVDSVYVDIVPAPITCTPTLNNFKSSDGIVNMNVGASGSINEFGKYTIRAGSMNAEVTLTFDLDSIPKNEGTFITTRDVRPENADEVKVVMRVYHLRQTPWEIFTFPEKQWIHLSYENGEPYITFCDIPVTTDATVSGKFLVKQ